MNHTVCLPVCGPYFLLNWSMDLKETLPKTNTQSVDKHKGGKAKIGWGAGYFFRGLVTFCLVLVDI